MLKNIKKLLQVSAISLLVFLSNGKTVGAANLSISNVPLFLASTVQPNVFFLLDDSGSMDFEILTNPHHLWIQYDSDPYNLGWYQTADYGLELWKDGFYVSAAVDAVKPSAIVGMWSYMYDNNNAYGNTCGGNATATSALVADTCSTTLINPMTIDWRVRVPQFNVTFFNPSVLYKPWNGPCDASMTPCADANFFLARNNPYTCATCAKDTRDLSVRGDGEEGPFRYEVWVDDSGFACQANDPNSATYDPNKAAFDPATEECRPMTGDYFNETGVASGGAAEPNGLVDLWDTHLRFTVNSGSVTLERISYSPQTSSEPSPGMNKTVKVLATLNNATACYDILGSQDMVQAIYNQGPSAKYGSTGSPGCRTISDAQTNIANWYSYSRRRAYAMKKAISQVIDAQPAFDYGISKFKTTGEMFVEVPEVGVSRPAHNEKLKGELFQDKLEGTGTLLLSALKVVGEYFSGAANRPDPIKYSCQKNFEIVFTDGYYNDSADATYSDHDGDGIVRTAADLAFYYYKNDLRPDMTDNVTVDPGEEEELDQDGDKKTWQHLVTFTVGFGVSGVLTDPNIDGWPDKDVAGADWTDAKGVATAEGLPFRGGKWGDPISCGKNECQAKIDDLWHMAWNTNGTYAQASSPEEVVEKLLAAIINIAGRAGSAAAVALNSGTLNANTRVYQAKFNSIDWTGDLQSIPVKDGDADATNDPPECLGKTIGEVCDVEWSASEELEKTLYSSRKVYTKNSDTNAGVAFKDLSTLGKAQQIALRTNPDTGVLEVDTRGQDRIDYLLGREVFDYDADFRVRTTGEFGVMKLGDVIASSPAYVGEPSFIYPDGLENSKYSEFVAAKKNRQKMVYVGANDGMLHGFSAADGKEKYAYIPSTTVNKLNKLTSKIYKNTHEYYIDGSPVTFDAYYGGWKTLLVTPAGAGGQVVFGLDVTDPTAFGEKTALWEFDDSVDPDMGFSMGDVTYGKLNDGRWAVFIGNGYNSTVADGNASTTGNAVIYVVDAFTGDLIRKFDTGVGMPLDPLGGNRPNGIASVTPVDLNGDLKTDFLYAGDLFGNVWKVSLKGTSSASWSFAYKDGLGAPKPFFKAVDANGVAQPITTGVSVKRHPVHGDEQLVLFGTGKYFEIGDDVITSSTQIDTFYSVWDDNTGTQYLRTQMLEHDILYEEDTDSDGMTDWRVTSSDQDPSGDYTIDWSKHKGWYLDLRYTGGIEYGERVIRKAVLRNNRVIFVTTVPDPDPCGFGGSSWIMELNANTGSRLLESPFDVNGDGIIDATDLLDISGQDTIVSGTRSKEGIVATPGILNTPDGAERKYFSGTSGNIDVVLESIPDEFIHRQSWRQLR